MSTSQEKKIAILQLILAGVLWSTGGILIKLVPWHALAISGSRSVIASVLLFSYMRYRGWKIKWSKRSVLTGLAMMGSFSCFVTANKLTTAANAIVLQYMSPIFILLIGILFLHQKARKGDIVVVALTFVGIALFFFDQLTPGKMAGNLIAILAGLLLAFLYVFQGEAEEEERMSGLFFGHLFTAFLGIPVILYTKPEFNEVSVVCILALGIFQIGIPYVLLGLAMNHCNALTCNLVAMVEPLLNPVWVFLFYGEAPGMFAFIGAAIVVAGVTGWCVWNDYYEKAQAAENPI